MCRASHGASAREWRRRNERKDVHLDSSKTKMLASIIYKKKISWLFDGEEVDINYSFLSLTADPLRCEDVEIRKLARLLMAS